MSASNCPQYQYLVKAVFNDKLKIFQLKAPTMASLWEKIRCAFDIPNSVESTLLQGQYVDKDDESILLDTDEELMLAFAICDVPLRINVESRSNDANAKPVEPVAVPVRNDAVTKATSVVYNDDGFVAATKVFETDASSDDDDSSSSDENDLDSSPWVHTDPDKISCAVSTLAKVGVVVQARNLQAFMQALQVPVDRLFEVGVLSTAGLLSTSTAGTIRTDQKRAQGLKKMKKMLAKCDRRQAVLMAKHEKVKAKFIAKKAKVDSKFDRQKDSAFMSTPTTATSSKNQYDTFGDWWVVEQALPTDSLASADSLASGKDGTGAGGSSSGGSSGGSGKVEHLQRKLLWPFFWRRVLFQQHDVDMEAGVIRKLCALLRIRKGRLFRQGLATRKEFILFSNSQDVAIFGDQCELPEEGGPEFCKDKGGGFGWKGKGKGYRHGHGWKGKGRGGGMSWCEHRRRQHEAVGQEDVDDKFGHPDLGQEDSSGTKGDFNHPDFGQLHDGNPWQMWHMKGKGKGKYHHHHMHHMWMMEKGKGKGDFHQHEHHMWMMENGKGKKGKGMRHNNEQKGKCQKGKGRGGGWGCSDNYFSPGFAAMGQTASATGDGDDSCGWRRHGAGRGGMRAWGEESGEGGKCLVRFVSHVTVPDGTVVQAGESFLKIWSVRNDGNQPWPAECELVTVGGGGGKGRRRDDDRGAAENADGTATTLVRGAAFRVPLSAVVPGKEVRIALDFRAPHEPGMYQVFFRLRDAAHGKKFGQRLWFSIMVKEKVTSMDGINPVQPIGSGSRTLGY